MEPDVRYCTTADGVRIAYTVTGDGPVLVWVAEPIASHVRLEWSHPVGRRALEELQRHNTLIRFDTRGSGLSERVLPTTLDAMVLDIEAVVDRLQLADFALTGMQNGTPATIAFAARHAERVRRLVIIDGYARFADLYATPQAAALVAAAASDWEMATEAIGAMVFGAGREESRNHGAFIRSCIGPEYFATATNFASVDVSALASTLPMPVLVVRHEGIRWITDEMTRDLASCIPDARLVTVEGTWPDDPEGLVKRIAAFVNDGPQQPTSPVARKDGTAVILFTDIVSSTALTERMGDAAFRDASRLLDQGLRAAMRANGGTPVDGKLLGDGVMGTFASAREAIAAAMRCSALSADSEIGLHIGLHAGDVIREENNVYGGAVNIASRICALSAPGEILVSDVVRGMARTSAGVQFEDRGEQEMKGVGDPVRVYEVRGRD